MRIKPALIPSFLKQDLIYISILLTIALVIGIYLITTTVVIAKDGVTFIEYAKNLDIAPTKTVINEDQHPGYPAMILAVHKIIGFLNENNSVFSWIYSAQSVALMFRLLAIVVLYFTGRHLVGPRFTFWAILILIFLPKPASYGSDALSDWPHLFFLAFAMLLLIQAAIHNRWWLFGFAGISAGLGYLVRPECAQAVVYGCLWLVLQLFFAKRNLAKAKTLFALALLVTGFLLAAGPYMKLKGAVFPKKKVGQFAASTEMYRSDKSPLPTTSDTTYKAEGIPSEIATAIGKLFANIGETLMWFFVPAWLIGLFMSFRRISRYKPEQFLITLLIALNVSLMLWLFCKTDYMSGRHTLPLVVFTIFYIPVGLHTSASWLQQRLSKQSQQADVKKENAHFGFVVLVSIGIAICTPKLLRPLHHDKIIFRRATQWLSENTLESDLVATPDLRITFYSEREGNDYKHHTFSENVQYVVRVYKKKPLSGNDNLPRQANILYTDESDDKYRIDIYKSVN